MAFLRVGALSHGTPITSIRCIRLHDELPLAYPQALPAFGSLSRIAVEVAEFPVDSWRVEKRSEGALAALALCGSGHTGGFLVQCPQGRPSPWAGGLLTGAPQLPLRLMGWDWCCWGVFMGLQKKQSPRGLCRAGWWVGHKQIWRLCGM